MTLAKLVTCLFAAVLMVGCCQAGGYRGCTERRATPFADAVGRDASTPEVVVPATVLTDVRGSR